VELLPWSAKAEDLLRRQYAPTGAAARAALSATESWIAQASARDFTLDSVLELAKRTSVRGAAIDTYVEEYRRYCCMVNGFADLRVAPFHILAFEGSATLQNAPSWHLQLLDRLCEADASLLRPTGRPFVDLTDAHSESEATA